MKKNYMRPESTVVKIEVSQLIMASDPNVTVNTNDDDAIEAGNVGSRYYNDWDD